MRDSSVLHGGPSGARLRHPRRLAALARLLGGACLVLSAWGSGACEPREVKPPRIVPDGEGEGEGEGELRCGDVECPLHPLDWPASRNVRDHCEHAPADGPLAAEIWVPPGVVPMGSPDEEDPRDDREGPVHDVTFARGFWIGKYEVTVAQYQACRNAGVCGEPSVEDRPGPNGLNTMENGRLFHPQNGLQWQQAVDYCTWREMRLPSESEWEYAAKGPVHRKYPWGDEPEPTCANDTAVFNEDGDEVVGGHGCGSGGTAPVGSKPAGASWSGALDMAGNVWEWVEDCFHHGYGGSPPLDGSAWTIDCSEHPADPRRVQRGGAFPCSSRYLRVADRFNMPSAVRDVYAGCRCVRPLMP